MPTIKVHKKCRFYSMLNSKCNLTNCEQQPWDDSCSSFELKDDLIYNFNIKVG